MFRLLASLARMPWQSPVRFGLVLAGLLVLALTSYYVRRELAFHKHLQLAQTAIREGRNSGAIDELSFCERIHSDNARLMLLSARIFWMMQAWSRAEDVLDQYVTIHGEDEPLNQERVLLKAARDDTDSLAPLLRSWLLRGGETATMFRIAFISGLLREFRLTEAQSLLDDWRAEGSDEPMADFLRARLEEMLSNTQGAIEIYSKMVERHPDHHEARLRLVMLYMQQYRSDVALPHLELLRRAMPDHADVAVQWALVLRQQGRTEESMIALDDAMRRFPNSSVALAERGTLALNEGEDIRAAEYLSESLKRDPGAIGVRNLYVQVLTRLGRKEDAKREEERVKGLIADSNKMTELLNGPLQTRPNDPNPPFELAGIALRSGQPDAAIRWYQLALKRSPRHAPSHTALAVIYHEMGNVVLATRHRALATTGRDFK